MKGTNNSEAGVMPSEKLLDEMGQYNAELVKAGIMLAGDGLHPSVKGKRIKFSGSKRSVVDGPFASDLEPPLLSCRGAADAHTIRPRTRLALD